MTITVIAFLFLFSGLSRLIPTDPLRDTCPVLETSFPVTFNVMTGSSFYTISFTQNYLQKKNHNTLPANYEPWIMQLYKYFRKKEDKIFPFTRQKVGKYVRDKGVFENLKYPVERYNIMLPGKVRKVVNRHMRPYNLHALRHSHATELVEYYGFDGFNLCVYLGWTLKAGVGITPVAGRYLSLSWQSYFPKLLKERY